MPLSLRGKAKERIEVSWREKAKELGYDPDSVIQKAASSIAEMGLGSGDSGGDGTATVEGEEVSE